MSVNEPVLLGFVKGTELDPRRVLYNCTLHSIEKSDENRLKDLYYIWNAMLKKIDKDYKNNLEIKWNFTKFVVDRKGNVVARFEPTDKMENEILLQTKKL